MKTRRTGLGVLIFSLVVFALTGIAWTQKQAIYDWARLRNYTPPAEIAKLAKDATMNEPTTRLFYVYHPELNDKSAFNHNCSGFGEKTIVLGCYVSPIGIYIFDIDDPRLAGVKQVTAAHELLHAAYDRLSSGEREQVDRMTAAAFETVTDPRIKDNVESYRRRDPAIVSNELHSILATEVRDLPDDLEEYYRKYFDNRLKIVEYSEKYESVLIERRNKAASLEIELTSLKNEIEAQERNLTAERDALRADRPGVNTQAEAVAYNARVGAYNADIHRFNALIEEYNNLLKEYRENVVEQQELYKALDSRPTI